MTPNIKKTKCGIALLLICFNSITKNFVTNENAGQFGHAFISLCLTLYLSKKYTVDFFLTPFTNFNLLSIEADCEKPNNEQLKNYNKYDIVLRLVKFF